MSTSALSTAAVWSRRLAVGTVLVTGGHLIGVPALSSSVTLAIVGLGLIAGIPHGAVDHLTATRLARGRSLTVIAACYAAVAAVVWVLLRWAGPAALVAVVVLSAVHFGLGELEVTRRLTGWRPGRLTAAATVVAGCGALALPLARSDEQFSAVAAAVSPGLARLLGAAPLQIGVIAVWLGCAVVASVAAVREGHTVVALDIVLIGALGLVAPPLVAFAVWFGGWHAVRHSARLLSVEPGCAALLARGRRRAAVHRLAGLAALPSLAVLMAVGALAGVTLAAPDPTAAVAEALRVLLALTVPHMVVVFWLDHNPDAEPGVGQAAAAARSTSSNCSPRRSSS